MQKYNARLKFHLTENEIAKIDKAAAKAGMNRSEYLRSLIRNSSSIPFPKPDLFPFIQEANEIGLIVNQIAVRAHTQSFIDIEKVATCMQRLQKLIGNFFEMYAEFRAEVKKQPTNNTLIPKGEKRELCFRLSREEKEKLMAFADQAKLSEKNYLKALIEGRRPPETPPNEYLRSVHEVRCIHVNICSIYMRSISLHDPAQDVLGEYYRFLQKAVAGLVHWY